jgi:ABC-type branched-subunit amino acid transport system substrate-binding protein
MAFAIITLDETAKYSQAIQEKCGAIFCTYVTDDGKIYLDEFGQPSYELQIIGMKSVNNAKDIYLSPVNDTIYFNTAWLSSMPAESIVIVEKTEDYEISDAITFFMEQEFSNIESKVLH